MFKCSCNSPEVQRNLICSSLTRFLYHFPHKLPNDLRIWTLGYKKICEKSLICLDDLPCAFSKNVSSKERVKPWFFVNFNIIISYIFPENFIEIPHVVQKIWRISLSILANFINFHQFSGILFNNCIKLYSY